MKQTPLLLGLILVLSACTAPAAPSGPKNVLLICVDDLRPELRSFGAEYIHSPNMDRLAKEGRAFHQHFVNAPSCGPSRYTLLTGRYGPPLNDALFLRAKAFEEDPTQVPPSMPEWFRKHGYTTVSVGKVSHHPGGRGGDEWDDDSVIEVPLGWDRHLMPCREWETPKGAMHGLAHGKVRKRTGDHDLFESVEGDDSIYPDGPIAQEGIRQLEVLAKSDKPFFLAIGLLKPHLPFGAPAAYMDYYQGVEMPEIPHPEQPVGLSTWHDSFEFMSYQRWGRDPNVDHAFAMDVKRHYAACVSYADKHVGDIVAALKAIGADKDTIIVLWGDHGWHLGEHAVWGKHTLFEEALHAPLVVCYPGIQAPGIHSNGIVETADIFPTLCDLTGVEMPDFVAGTSLLTMLNDPCAPGRAAYAYRPYRKTLRTQEYRIIVHEKEDLVELYDHRSDPGETHNVAAENPTVVAHLKQLIEQKQNPGF